MTCSQMIEGREKKSRNPENGVSQTHSIAFPIHSTPFNRIFLIYFHYASKRASMMPHPWLAQSCTAHSHGPWMTWNEAVTYIEAHSTVHLWHHSIGSVYCERTNDVLQATFALCFHFASHRSFYWNVSMRRLNLFMATAIPVCLHILNSISHRLFNRLHAEIPFEFTMLSSVQSDLSVWLF